MAVGPKLLTNVGETVRQRLDLASVALSVPAFGALVDGLSQIGAAAAGSGLNVKAVAALGVGVAALALFVARQLRPQRRSSPLLDLRAFTYRMSTISTLLVVAAMMALFGGVLLRPIYLQSVLHVDAQATGLILLRGGIIMGLSGPVIGRLSDRIGPLPLTVSGSVHMAFTSGLNPLPPAPCSHGSAIMSTLRQVAGAAGTALLVSTYIIASAHGDPAAGMRAAFLAAKLVSVAAVELAALMRRTAPDSG